MHVFVLLMVVQISSIGAKVKSSQQWGAFQGFLGKAKATVSALAAEASAKLKDLTTDEQRSAANSPAIPRNRSSVIHDSTSNGWNHYEQQQQQQQARDADGWEWNDEQQSQSKQQQQAASDGWEWNDETEQQPKLQQKQSLHTTTSTRTSHKPSQKWDWEQDLDPSTTQSNGPSADGWEWNEDETAVTQSASKQSSTHQHKQQTDEWDEWLDEPTVPKFQYTPKASKQSQQQSMQQRKRD